MAASPNLQGFLDDRVLGLSSSSVTAHPSERPNETSGEVVPFPYATAIRKLLERDQLPAARRLLEVALANGQPSPGLASLARVLAPPRVSRSSYKDVDRSSEYNWLKTQASAYAGLWVALKGERVVADATSLKELLSVLRELSLPIPPLVVRIP